MGSLDEIFLIRLGWTWVYEYAALIFIIAAALVLILLITFIAVAVCHSKNKKKFKKLNDQLASQQSSGEQVQDSGELRAEIRKEMEPIIREQVEREYRSKQPVADDQAAQQIAELNNTIREKDARIDELGAALGQANNARTNDNTELYRTINDLNQSNKQLQNDVNILKAENAQLKSNANSKTAESAAKSTATKQTAKKQAPVKAVQPEPEDEDDEDDEYYDEFGDETSAIKVTLKYDRLKMNWVIYRSDIARAYRRVATKQEGLIVAKDLARRLHAQLVVHKKDGKFQKLN